MFLLDAYCCEVVYFYQEVKYLEGIVKKWLDRGYGFIDVEGNDDDVFVHHSSLDGAYELSEGQNVTFDIEDSPKGPRAINVKIVE
jgi:CspA family cold shock protein